jgi:hypothetical protein
VLTSIEVECEADASHADLLRRFQSEFRPEQIKQYLARDVIAGLRNASAIDLTQFAGLNAVRPVTPAEDDGYADLLAELQASTAEDEAPPYQVTLMGRWTSSSAHAAAPPREARDPVPATPTTTRPFALDIHDTSGLRQVDLAAVVPGRRYVIGKDGGCDVVVDGTYASRRHCEIWYDRGTWWAADCGSTNGIRVESDGRIVRASARSPAGGAMHPVEWPSGASLVLSAHAIGDATQYPRVVARPVVPDAPEPPTAIASTAPATPIAPAMPPAHRWIARVEMAGGARDVQLSEHTLPFTIGRSRNQSLIVDWSHAAVSGRHVEIVALDADGASIVVHGDNGILVDGRPHAMGARLTWRAGETLRLGQRAGEAAGCVLTLAPDR